MENASKALLIAGAILVCILIIGIGMLVYGSIQGTVQEGISQMSSQEKDLFNQQFQQYEGTRVNGSNVKALINRVNNNNSQLEDPKDPKYVTVNKGQDITINTAQTYSVTVTDSNGDGLVDEINISLYSNKKDANS